ncbi:MAG: hypothetical protein LBT14_03180 [Treponema sp.]|nr:hypothetical protein [Treponema sp.]
MKAAMSANKMPMQILGELVHEKIAQDVVEPVMRGRLNHGDHKIPVISAQARSARFCCPLLPENILLHTP